MNIGNPSRRAIIATASVSAAVVLATAGSAIAASYTSISLEVDGVTRPVEGFFTDVAGALSAADVEVGAHDQVAPAKNSRIFSGDTLVVRSAHAYQVTIDGQLHQTWSTAESVDEILEGIDGDGQVILAADRSSERHSLPARGNNETITVEADGGTTAVSVDGAADIDTILTRAGITVSPLDRVQFVGENGDVKVTVTRVSRGYATETTAIPFATEERHDDTLNVGEQKVIQEGSEGHVTTTYYRETVDGVVRAESVLSEERVEPVTRIVSIGTKEATVAETPSSQSAAQVTSTDVGSDVWAALAQCESGGNPTINTGNGYYGLYQFSLSTWQSLGGTGLPSEASAAEQTALAQQLQARAGWGQWPGCASRLGLY